MRSAAAHASILHMLPAHLEKFGVDPSDVLHQAGMTLETLNENSIVPRAQLHGALSLAAKLTGQPEIALALGNASDTARLGPACLAFSAGSTLEQCLRGHIALMPRLQTQVSIELLLDGPLAVLGHQLVGDGQAAWLLYEGAAAFHLKQFRAFMGDDWSPNLITFPHACRGRVSVYRDYFNCDVRFGVGAAARIYFPREELPAHRSASSPQVFPSRESLVPIGAFCPQQIERFSLDGDRIHEAIVRMVQAVLPHQSLKLSMAAARLGLSQRTIQRRLTDMECTFEDIVDRVRHRIALSRLSNSDDSITAIAMALGYSDAAHFNRAFRRWTGCSPSDFRLTAGLGPEAVNTPHARPKR